MIYGLMNQILAVEMIAILMELIVFAFYDMNGYHVTLNTFESDLLLRD